MNVLVINSGSSSLKYQLVDTTSEEAIATGIVERIGEDAGGELTHRYGESKTVWKVPIVDHTAALSMVMRAFDEVGPDLSTAKISAVGHRTVHGGSTFTGPALLDEAVVGEIDALSPLAPLHNPANVTGMRVARELFPDIPHVAVFDTAFFRTVPDAAATYAIDRDVAQRFGVRRYGFHGTSHEYVSREAAAFLGKDVRKLNQIVLHLGNGASASAIRAGHAVDTSMGLTPLAGLVMGTRSGDLDPGVILHLLRAGVPPAEIDSILNRGSGLKGLAGVSDFRELQQRMDSGDAAARLAFDVYVHRLRGYVGAYTAQTGPVDVLTFTGGVGENSPAVRASVCAGLEHLGYRVDRDRNTTAERGARRISPLDTPVEVLVVPTNEELAIARHAVALVGADTPA